jgi:hypothetical protein
MQSIDQSVRELPRLPSHGTTDKENNSYYSNPPREEEFHLKPLNSYNPPIIPSKDGRPEKGKRLF